jgi:hypothetical protein
LAADSKCNVATEAATLLYFGAEKEYKQAKIRAAQTLGTNFLPSNRDVALELDRISEEQEGEDRSERLVKMRVEALEIMKLLDAHCPVLIGSVWRGTIRLGSDIDIAVYADSPDEIMSLLRTNKIPIQKKLRTTVNKHGRTLESLHIYAQTPTKNGLEIVVRSTEEAGEKRKCEIFGDQIKGLRTKELEKLLKNYPTKKFIPA